jgi:uncharacterized membrane protein YgdD (TMEM256/DUF423 family)
VNGAQRRTELSERQTTGDAMELRQKLTTEVKALVITTAYFIGWFGMLVLLKKLVLEEYRIAFTGVSFALVAAVAVAKVVLVLEHVSLGPRIRRLPAVFDVFLRTVLYGAGAFGILLLEKAFESRHEYGGFTNAISNVLEHRDIPHVCANAICVGFALLGFNTLTIVRRHIGDQELIRYFVTPLPEHSR